MPSAVLEGREIKDETETVFVDCSPVKPSNDGSGESASDPINIDCSPVKKSTSNNLAYSGRASDFIRMRTRTHIKIIPLRRRGTAKLFEGEEYRG